MGWTSYLTGEISAEGNLEFEIEGYETANIDCEITVPEEIDSN